ncbi:unnamed protein product [Penicillium nalgiovense]|uniref:DUF7600 domain-containing protein n=1 Tax=Penicillium nalgiovense TaxID=60175 RepID=A0A9W4MLX3_PENNA|nr:unnamed protein product [Penicillium nalgiovense]CAG7993075.1 unnamed protein product [Penicillium nalgiovense]CAG8001601.1 unnamed protein product [Penicillium nalgiovense]CAG8011225.1 unnamed protein product [Penicillium nalgiovense]CAG8023382.1 unnamed protein product [Penicillium nalgiovense]
MKRKNTDSSNNPTSGTDCFGLLAMEIRLEIAAYLSTVGFFSLRYAPRAMALLFQLQTFWKTRFRVNGDRGFLAYLAEAPQNRKRKNWRSIYHCTARIDQPHLQLWTLRRIWRDNQWLADRCSMVKALDDKPRSQNNLLSGVSWKEASTKMRCDRTAQQGQNHTKCQTCYAYHYAVVQTVSLQNIIGLAVSILPEGTTTYITGFDLISADAGTPNIIFGYRLPGKQVTINLCGQKLRGFDVSLGEGGIQAIRPIFNTNINTNWIGETEGRRDYSLTQIISTQLILEDEIKVISGKFDVSQFCHYEP